MCDESTLPNAIYPARLCAFDAAAVGQSYTAPRSCLEPLKEGSKGVQRLFQHRWADGIDAITMAQLNGSRAHETVDGGIDGGGAGTLPDGFVTENAAGQRDGTARIQVMLPKLTTFVDFIMARLSR